MVSWVWNHFKKVDKECAKCNHCAKKIDCKSGNTSGLSRHLKNVHSIQEIAKNQNKIETFLNVKKDIINSGRYESLEI